MSVVCQNSLTLSCFIWQTLYITSDILKMFISTSYIPRNIGKKDSEYKPALIINLRLIKINPYLFLLNTLIIISFEFFSYIFNVKY